MAERYVVAAYRPYFAHMQVLYYPSQSFHLLPPRGPFYQANRCCLLGVNECKRLFLAATS